MKKSRARSNIHFPRLLIKKVEINIKYKSIATLRSQFFLKTYHSPSHGDYIRIHTRRQLFMFDLYCKCKIHTAQDTRLKSCRLILKEKQICETAWRVQSGNLHANTTLITAILKPHNQLRALRAAFRALIAWHQGLAATQLARRTAI